MTETKREVDTRGYQVIEPSELRPLEGEYEKVYVKLLEWLISRLERELGDALRGTSLSVITVQYLSSYPAIGVKYAYDRSDVGPQIESLIDLWLGDPLLNDFLEFIRNSSRSRAECETDV